MLDFFTAVTKIFDAGVGSAVSMATTATSAVNKGLGFLDENPLAKRIAKAATGSAFATEDVNQRTSSTMPSLDYEPARVNTASNIGVIKNPRLQLALSRINNRDINLGLGLQKVADMSAPAVRPNKPRMTPRGVERTKIKTTVKQPTTTRKA